MSGNQIITFAQLIKYVKRNISLQNEAGKLVPELVILKKLYKGKSKWSAT